MLVTLTRTIQTSADSPVLAMHRKVWEAMIEEMNTTWQNHFIYAYSKIFNTTVACNSENAQLLCQHFYSSSYQSDIYFK
jgi:hypothetical protein